MFYVAQISLLSRDLSFSSHAAVISAFGREFVKSGEVPKDLHRYLIDAAKARTDGDHSTEVRLSQDNAIVQLQRAQVFLDVARQRCDRTLFDHASIGKMDYDLPRESDVELG